MDARAHGPRALDPRSNLHRLHRLNGHHRPSQPPIELLVPLSHRAEPRRDAARHHFKDAAHRVFGLERPIHFLLHARLSGRVHAIENDLFFIAERQDFFKWNRVALKPRRADRQRVAGHLDLELAQENFRQRARRHARRRLASARALQHIAGVAEIIFQAARQVGMAGTRR